MKALRRQVETALEAALPDRLIAKKDGTLEVRRSYFYHHGLTPGGYWKRVQQALRDANIQATLVDSGDHYASGPYGAYVWVRFTVTAEIQVAVN